MVFTLPPTVVFQLGVIDQGSLGSLTLGGQCLVSNGCKRYELVSVQPPLPPQKNAPLHFGSSTNYFI